MKTAIIVGSQGQDGILLKNLLQTKKYHIVSIDKEFFEINKKPENKYIDITIYNDVRKIIKTYLPDEVYFLAAYHHSSEDNKINELTLLNESYKINVLALNNFLLSIKDYSSKTKLFYASSSLIFGGTKTIIQNENTPFEPNTIYGITKLNGLLLCRYYYKMYNIFACVGIFYNHESKYRNENFLSKKIISTAIKIKNKTLNQLIIGNINAEIDWGYAPDYVTAAYKMMQLTKPYELIIATGKKHNVKYFIQTAFKLLNLEWSKYIKQDPKLLTRNTTTLVGDSTKIKNLTNWNTTVSFEEMIKLLLLNEGATLNE